MISIAAWVLLSQITMLLDPSTITRWSRPEPIVGEIAQISKQGLEVRIEGEDIPRSVPWFDIREIQPASNAASQFLDDADTAWRAHARLARGDYPAALELYTRLAPGYLWGKGAQSADVSLGLAMCLIEQGDRVRSIGPALSWFVGSGVHAPGQASGATGVDGSYGLLIALPPVFTARDRMVAIEPLPESPLIAPRERLLHACFALALTKRQGTGAQELIDQIDELGRAPGARDAGVELVKDIVMARAHPDPEQRTASRKALDRRARVSPDSWVEVWARLGLAAAMLSDDDARSNERGLIELIHVIVRLRDVNPTLTQLAAQMAQEYLIRTDRPRWAAQLMLDALAPESETNPFSQSQEHDADD